MMLVHNCLFVSRRKRMLWATLLVLTAVVLSASGCREFRKGRYNGSHFKMTAPRRWREGTWTIPTVLPAENLYDLTQFTVESPKRHKKTGTPEASISLFAQKLETVMWMEDLYPTIIREYHRAGYTIMDKGEIKLDGDNIFKWIVSKNLKRDEVAMDFYFLSEASVFYKIQYAAHAKTFNQYRKFFEEAKRTIRVKITFI